MGKWESVARARQERRIYYPPRLRRRLRALACFAVALVSLWALITGSIGEGETITYALAGAFVFFGGSGVVIIFRLRKRRPVLVMDAHGLTVRARSGRAQRVDWEAITDVNLYPGPHMKVLAISHLKGRTHWADRAAFWRSGERHYRFGKVAIPSARIAAPLKKVEAEIRRRLPE